MEKEKSGEKETYKTQTGLNYGLIMDLITKVSSELPDFLQL